MTINITSTFKPISNATPDEPNKQISPLQNQVHPSNFIFTLQITPIANQMLQKAQKRPQETDNLQEYKKPSKLAKTTVLVGNSYSFLHPRKTISF